MQLKDFVKQSLENIVQGVMEAQRSNATKAVINPQVSSSQGPNRDVLKHHGVLWDGSDYSLIEHVQFDVAVTAEEENQINGGFNAGIQVLGLSAKAGIDNNSKSSTVSRIKFSVAVKYPPSSEKKIIAAEMSSGQSRQQEMVDDINETSSLIDVRHGG
jgi:hypothetical protein